jgi:hypothetical protein
MLAKDASRACLSGILSQNFQGSVGNDRALFSQPGRARWHPLLASPARAEPRKGTTDSDGSTLPKNDTLWFFARAARRRAGLCGLEQLWRASAPNGDQRGAEPAPITRTIVPIWDSSAGTAMSRLYNFVATPNGTIDLRLRAPGGGLKLRWRLSDGPPFHLRQIAPHRRDSANKALAAVTLGSIVLARRS